MPPQMPNFAATCAIMAARRNILSTTRAILVLTWFCHLSMCLWSLGGAWGAPRGDPPLYMKNNQCLKLIFRPFGTKKNWKWKMTLADPPPPLFHFYFEPYPNINLNFKKVKKLLMCPIPSHLIVTYFQKYKNRIY